MVISTKTAKPIDKHVGSRVRARRKILGLSQEALGMLLGITYQQPSHSKKPKKLESKLKKPIQLFAYRCTIPWNVQIRLSRYQKRHPPIRSRREPALHPRVTKLERLLKLCDAFAEGVASLYFVVHATREPFDLAFDDIEAAIHFREVLVDRGELSYAGIGERLDQAIDVRETFLHARDNLSKAVIDLLEASINMNETLIDLGKALFGASEALVHLVFDTVETVVEIGFLHIGKYTTAFRRRTQASYRVGQMGEGFAKVERQN
jgi:transcriptional regulator with XRE-family HTH domain